MTHVTGTLSVGSEVVQTFTSSAKSSENIQLADVIAQLKEVRNLSNSVISKLMKEYPDEGKDIDMEEEGEEEEDPEPEPEKKETKKKRKLDKRKKSQEHITMTTNMEDVPEYVLAKILSFLPLHDLLTTFRVCSQWRQAAKYDFLWQEQRRVFLGLLESPPLTKKGMSHRDQFFQEYTAPIEVFVAPKIETMSCFGGGIPEREKCIKMQLFPTYSLAVIQEIVYSKVNVKEDRRKPELHEIDLVACLNGLFNVNSCTPLITVLNLAASLLQYRSISAKECAANTLDCLDNHGITNIRQILSFSQSDFVEREVEVDMAASIMKVIGKVPTFVNFHENSVNWRTLTLRQCGIKSGSIIKIIPTPFDRHACSHYYATFVGLPDPAKLPKSLNFPLI